MHQPESPKCSPKAQGLLHIVFRLSTFERPFKGHAQVFMLVFHSIQPGGLFWTREFRLYLLGECQVVIGMSPARHLHLFICNRALHSPLPNRLLDVTTWLPLLRLQGG